MSTSAAHLVDRAAPVAAGPFLQVRDLRVHFPTDDGVVRSVDGLSFTVERGQTLGIVGESGSGKSVTSLSIMGLHAPGTAEISGQVMLNGGGGNTVTVKLQLLDRPQESVALQLTLVVPIGNTLPLGGTQLVVIGGQPPLTGTV